MQGLWSLASHRQHLGTLVLLLCSCLNRLALAAVQRMEPEGPRAFSLATTLVVKVHPVCQRYKDDHWPGRTPAPMPP